MIINQTREHAGHIREIASGIESCVKIAEWLTMYKNGEFQLDEDAVDQIATAWRIGGLYDAIYHLSACLDDKGEWIAGHSVDKASVEVTK